LFSSSSDDNEKKEHWRPRKKKTGFLFQDHLKTATKKLQTRIVIKHLTPIENIKDDRICMTPNVNMLSLDSRNTDDEIVTPNPRALSESFVSKKVTNLQ